MNIQNQHFHHAAWVAFFWADKIDEEPRESVISFIDWELFINQLINKLTNNKNHKNELKIFSKKACKIMSSYMITEETEKKMSFWDKEYAFYNLSKNLYSKSLKDDNFIQNYICNEGEYKIIYDYFCMQSARNPNNYIEHLTYFFSDLIISQKNPYCFNIFDTNNTENLINFINNKIIDDYSYYFNKFNNYEFKIIKNPESNNILTDNTVIKLNHNDYFRMLFKENYSKVEAVFEQVYIITINHQYLLFFYPNHFNKHIDIIKDIYLRNQLTICLLYSRNIIFKTGQEEQIKKKINDFLQSHTYDQLKCFLKFYVNMHYPITAMEDQILNYKKISNL